MKSFIPWIGGKSRGLAANPCLPRKLKLFSLKTSFGADTDTFGCSVKRVDTSGFEEVQNVWNVLL